MSKLKEFLNETSDMTNKERLVIAGCTIGLVAMANILNFKLFSSRLDGIGKDAKIGMLESELDELKKNLVNEEITQQDDI